jgi:Methyltransferase domain
MNSAWSKVEANKARSAPIQPNWVPSNCSFEIDDIERDWLWQKARFDFIHGRELMLAIKDWPRLLRQTFEHLKPGGFAEFAGSYPEIGCDDGTLPSNSAYEETGHIWFAIGDALGVSCRAPAQWKTLMREAGFVDVQERIYKIPSNPWPKDPRLKKVGAFELVQYRDQVSGIFLRGFTRGLGRSREEWEATIAQARTEVANKKIHAYIK